MLKLHPKVLALQNKLDGLPGFLKEKNFAFVEASCDKSHYDDILIGYDNGEWHVVIASDRGYLTIALGRQPYSRRESPLLLGSVLEYLGCDQLPELMVNSPLKDFRIVSQAFIDNYLAIDDFMKIKNQPLFDDWMKSKNPFLNS